MSTQTLPSLPWPCTQRPRTGTKWANSSLWSRPPSTTACMQRPRRPMDTTRKQPKHTKWPRTMTTLSGTYVHVRFVHLLSSNTCLSSQYALTGVYCMLLTAPSTESLLLVAPWYACTVPQLHLRTAKLRCWPVVFLHVYTIKCCSPATVPVLCSHRAVGSP